jgi:hypothetical protein
LHQVRNARFFGGINQVLCLPLLPGQTYDLFPEILHGEHRIRTFHGPDQASGLFKISPDQQGSPRGKGFSFWVFRVSGQGPHGKAAPEQVARHGIALGTGGWLR